ncbi:hypothetical protein VIN01S_11070 [Vibrio inusitatus NBRC 102082]|uniref:DUF4381 domain-containing protein n=1 Tax=Vibrio inusitatus NBRC 102082 TaxID=1219070 RepID=A0A4Y3HT21_9VIBR|nr:DUF4381 domain-containing protein [Vibrio inusitatus]GEA50303.1 hypothetical protein VIN01S_11070 [Vibrio inusitatus NBRC 102082]
MSTTAETLKPMSMNSMMSGLAEPSLPGPISWIPNAPGWYVVIGIFACFAFYRVYLAYRKYQANVYRRMALEELNKLQKCTDGIMRLPQLLRKTALDAYPRHQVSPLLGAQWESWLDRQCKGSQFSTQFNGLLASLSYSSNPAIDQQQCQGLYTQAAHWIKHHEVDHG